MKHIVFNADDFGMSPEVNEGIKRAIEAGVVKSVSVMVNMPYLDDAIKYLKKHPDVAVGLHFNITEGIPLSPVKEITSLVREDGSFSNLFDQVVNLVVGISRARDLEQELTMQFRKLQKTGVTISHIDSHHHIHLHPKLFRIFLDFAIRHRIQSLRGRKFRFTRGVGVLNRKFFLKQIIILSLCFLVNLMFNHKKRFFDLDHLYDINWLTGVDRHRFLRFLDHIPDGRTQIICHPAVLSKEGNTRFLTPRQKELDMLLDRKVRKKLKHYL